MSDTTITGDLIYGTKRIADFLGVPVRAAEHMVETKRIPFFKMGKTVCARRSRLQEHLDRLEDNSAA
jgi:excisionase family DNA binding protein